jgi:hypothetical protein
MAQLSPMLRAGLYRNASLCMLDLSMNRLDSSGALILEAHDEMWYLVGGKMW